jgi:hypothetical protein
VHDTPFRLLLVAPLGLGVASTVHAAAVNLVVVFGVPSGPTQTNDCPDWKFPHT